MSKSKKIIVGVLFLVLVALALTAWSVLKPKATVGDKTVEVLIVHADGSEKAVTIDTDAQTLRAALEQEELIFGDESEYGLYVKTVDGETADEALQQWWNFSKSGEMLMTGVDDTMIADGEHYEITLETGW